MHARDNWSDSMRVMEGTHRRLFYGRVALALLAFGWGPVFAISPEFTGDGWIVLDVVVVVVCLGGAVVWQSWKRPPILDATATRRRPETRLIGPWRADVLPEQIRATFRRRGMFMAFGALIWAGFAVVQAVVAEGFNSWLLGVGCLGALATAMFAARSELQINGQEVLERAVFGEARVRYLRWREVEVGHLGPLRLIAPQLDDQSGGWILGRCARLQR